MGPIKRKVLTAMLSVSALLVVPAAAVSSPQETDAREKNIQEYIKLLRADVRQEKAEIMGSMMLLSAADAAVFWPIYNEYDTELNGLNDKRAANVKEYASLYPELTNTKADELIRHGLAYQKQRSELLAKTYERVKQSLGAITAARFVQVENQLLMIVDLQIASSLPVVGNTNPVLTGEK